MVEDRCYGRIKAKDGGAAVEAAKKIDLIASEVVYQTVNYFVDDRAKTIG